MKAALFYRFLAAVLVAGIYALSPSESAACPSGLVCPRGVNCTKDTQCVTPGSPGELSFTRDQLGLTGNPPFQPFQFGVPDEQNFRFFLYDSDGKPIPFHFGGGQDLPPTATPSERLGNDLYAAGFGGRVTFALKYGGFSFSVRKKGTGLRGFFIGDGDAAASYSPFWDTMMLGEGFFKDDGTVYLNVMKIGDFFNELWHAYYDQVVVQGGDPKLRDQFNKTKEYLKGQQVKRNAKQELATDIVNDFDEFTDDYISTLVDTMAKENYRLHHGMPQEVQKLVQREKMTAEAANEAANEAAKKGWQDLLDGKSKLTINLDANDGKGLVSVPAQPPAELMKELADAFGMEGF